MNEEIADFSSHHLTAGSEKVNCEFESCLFENDVELISSDGNVKMEVASNRVVVDGMIVDETDDSISGGDACNDESTSHNKDADHFIKGDHRDSGVVSCFERDEVKIDYSMKCENIEGIDAVDSINQASKSFEMNSEVPVLDDVSSWIEVLKTYEIDRRIYINQFLEVFAKFKNLSFLIYCKKYV